MMTRLLRRHWMMALGALCITGLGTSAEVQSGANVYILPMKSGFNLYLASRLTRSKILTVVTDPALADLVLSDSVDAAFEQSMEALYPKPKPEAAEKEAAAAKKDGSGMSSMADAYAATTQRPSSFSRSDGTYFLVDRQSRIVVWSTFLKRGSVRNVALDQDANDVVKRLQKYMKTASATSAP